MFCKEYFSHMIFLVYMIYLFLICIYIRGDFLATYCMYIIFKRGKILYIRGINFMVMHTHMVPDSNNECTLCGVVGGMGLIIHRVYIW